MRNKDGWNSAYFGVPVFFTFFFCTGRGAANHEIRPSPDLSCFAVLRIWDVYKKYEFGIRDPEKNYSGSGSKVKKRHRIRIRNTAAL